MKFKLLYSLTLIAVALCSSVYAQQTVKITPTGIGYLEYLPQGYNSNTNKYPLMISLHGIKERGTSSTDPALVKAGVPTVANVGIPKYIKYGAQYPCIVISPQLKSSYGSWPADYVIEVLNYVKKYLRVDERKIVITGLSLGGGGVWTTIGAYPSVFAAAAPICGTRSSTAINNACDIAAQMVPVWAFHGDKDAVVSYQVSVSTCNAINSCSDPKCNPQSKLTIYPGLGHVIWDKAYKESTVINWMLSFVNGTTTTPTNNAPVASAGSDKTITLPTNSVLISGSGSDSDGTVSSYSWTQVSGPSTAYLTNKTTKALTAGSLVAGTYSFQLKVTDNDGATDTDNVSVIVNSSADKNALPVANAGSDKTLTLPSNATTLYGSASDSDGTIASYQWVKKSGSSATLSGTTSKDLKLSGLVAGTYIFTLTAKDNAGAVDTDDVTVTVNSSSTTNVAPIAKAGSDKIVRLPTTSISVSGSATDSDGTISSYSWTKVSGVYCSMVDANRPMLKLSGLKSGSYVFRLTVKDNKGAIDTDDVTVIVDSPPIVNAGSDRTVTLPISSLSLTATASDSDGTIAKYQWSKYSGPIVDFSNASTKTLTINKLYQGTYVFKIEVKDNNGLSSYDYVKVVVNGSTAQITTTSDAVYAALTSIESTDAAL
jgi:hypothetical protein